MSKDRCFSSMLALMSLVAFGRMARADERVPPTVEVVVWRYHLVGQEEYYRALTRAYQKANRGHHVVIHIKDWSTAHEKLREWEATGHGPDLSIVPDVWLSEFSSGLDPYPDALSADFLQKFNQVMLDRSRLQGHELGLVWAASTKVLFYRTDLFRAAGLKPPTNWQELLHVAQVLNHPNADSYGLAIPGSPVLDTADNFYSLIWGAGGQLLSSEGHSAMQSEQAIDSLTFLRDLVLKYHVTEPGPTHCDRPCAEELFANGKAAMVETGPWLIQTIAAKSQPVSYSVAPLPFRSNRVTQLVTDHLVLFAGSQHKQEAMRFVQFAYQPSWRMRWARLGMVPELKTVEQDPVFVSDPIWRVFVNCLQDARWIPLVKWHPIDLAISQTLSSVLEGHSTPVDALGELSKRIDQLLAK